ncbi:Hypothetical protein A7982_03162 [Minicystis rosea]|nr:Hypothetical protein A7982_03162 [Minicystis rosea]
MRILPESRVAWENLVDLFAGLVSCAALRPGLPWGPLARVCQAFRNHGGWAAVELAAVNRRILASKRANVPRLAGRALLSCASVAHVP